MALTAGPRGICPRPTSRLQEVLRGAVRAAPGPSVQAPAAFSVAPLETAGAFSGAAPAQPFTLGSTSAPPPAVRKSPRSLPLPMGFWAPPVCGCWGFG